jgi:hypothetical protein
MKKSMRQVVPLWPGLSTNVAMPLHLFSFCSFARRQPRSNALTQFIDCPHRQIGVAVDETAELRLGYAGFNADSIAALAASQHGMP